MDFDWPPELHTKIDAARRFARERLSAPRPDATFDAEGFRAVAACGLFDGLVSVPDAARCRGALVAAATLEALGRGGADRSLLFAAGAHLFGCLVPLLTYASPEQSKRWESGLKSGTMIGALAATEAEGGSSLDGIHTEAVEAEGGFVLTGEKTLIGNAPVAGLFILLARLRGTPGPLGLTAFLVPGDAKGLAVNRMTGTAGLPRAAMGHLRLDGCFVPRDGVLGRVGAGLLVFSTAMQWERSCLLAGFLGAAERDLDLCLDALKRRRDRQGSVLRHQAVSHRLARVALGLQSARLLAQRAAWSIDQGREDLTAAAMAKLAMSEAVVAAAEDMARLLAGQGWSGRPFDTSAAIADALGGLFASGTSEIQLEVMARHLQSDRSVS